MLNESRLASKYYSDDQIKLTMRWSGHALGLEKCIQYVGGGEHEGNAYLEYQVIDGRLILNGCQRSGMDWIYLAEDRDI